MSPVKARRAARLLIHWQRHGLVTDRARHLSYALTHQARAINHMAIRGDAGVPMGDSVAPLVLRRDLALVAFYSSLASDRRSGHQETTQ